MTAAHADGLLEATPPKQRTHHPPLQPDEPKGDLQKIVKSEREMS